MYLSKSCIYAIRSALLLAAEEEESKFISIREISKRLDLPFHYLTKILQTLSHAKIVISIKGPQGGVSLNKAAESISLYDIILAMDNDFVFNQCTLGLAECSDQDPCVLHAVCHETKQILMDNMKRKNLKEVALTIRDNNFQIHAPY